MGRIFADVLASGRAAIFAVSLLAALAYTKWHYWWRTGFGRTRMALLLSISALTLTSLLHSWTGVDFDFNSTADYVIAAVDVAATAGVLAAVTYMLIRIITLNVRRVRHPARAADQGRRHLERTPWASAPDIEKLLACWDEIHP